MLEEDQAAAGCEHAQRLTQGGVGVVDAAQHLGADDAVEAGVVEGQLLGRGLHEVDRDGRVVELGLQLARHAGVGIDGGDRAHAGRVVGEVLAGADADLEHPPGCGVQGARAGASQGLALHDAVVVAGEEGLGVVAHRSFSLGSPPCIASPVPAVG
ncbi:MAG: hypothetical protein OXT09_36655 [Myxococcales bacterium]|nr:hypothetical protein [Myxococcales bacterium]